MFHFVDESSGMPSGFPFPGMMGGMGGFPSMGGMRGFMPSPDPPGTHTELYDRLDLPTSASEGDLRKAYKKLRVKLHPDRPGGDTVRFQEVQEAYEILSNPKNRELYDKWGKEGVEKMGNMAEPIKRKVRPIHVQVNLRLEDVFSKQTRTVSFQRSTLTGHREVGERVTESVDIPKGVPDDYRMTLRGKGHIVRNPKGDEDAGDVIVQVTYIQDRTDGLHAEGFELVKEMKVSFRLALLGGYVKVDGLNEDGKPKDLQVFIPPRLLFQGEGTKERHLISVPDKGLPIGSTGSRGSLCLACTVDLSPLRSIVVSKQLHRLLTEELPQPEGEADVPPSDIEPDDFLTAEAFREEDARQRLAWSNEFFGRDDDEEDGFGGTGGMGQRVECRQQ